MISKHSDDGEHFVGVRQKNPGTYEIVYEGASSGKRFVWSMRRPTNIEDISNKIIKTIGEKHVAVAIRDCLRAENIDFELRRWG
jgi:hypothetical protein